PLVVAQRLGHSDVSTTLNTYSHLYPSKQAEVVAFMEQDLSFSLPIRDLRPLKS
ncbi:site-specific integrase, partial [Bacillus cereus]|nr:site-specific integrase [Bacillus cereus]